MDKIQGAMKMPSTKVTNIPDSVYTAGAAWSNIISIGDNFINALPQTVCALRPTFEKLFCGIRVQLRAR